MRVGSGSASAASGGFISHYNLFDLAGFWCNCGFSRKIWGSKKGIRTTKPIARNPIYRRRMFDAEIIELCVRWYITYRLSYRDLVGMMAERGHGGPQHDSALGNPLRAGI